MNLLPFQKEAVSKMVEILRSRGGVYNASEMGLGKSAMALSAINEMPEITSVFIVCPAIVRLVWAAEINKWAKPNDSKYANCCQTALQSRFTVVSYNEAASKVKSIVENCYIDCLIIDEAHYVKSFKALRTKAVLGKLWPKAKYKICLSGTPMTQSVADLWTTFSRLAPEEFPDWWNFVNTYTKVRSTPWGNKYEGIKNADKLREIIRSTFFIRYTKAENLKDLPEKIWTKIPLGPEYRTELSLEEQRESEKYIELLKQSYIRDVLLNKPPPVAVANIRRRQGLKKVPAIIDFCKNLLDQEIPIVVFGYTVDVLKELARELNTYAPSFIIGATPPYKRKEAVDNFQDGRTNLFIANYISAGIGVTLTRSSICVFAEPDWSPAIINQAVDRLHRITQKNVVNIYYFIVADSLDSKIDDIVMEKTKVFNKILNG